MVFLTHLMKANEDRAGGVTYHVENQIAGDQFNLNVILVVFQPQHSLTTVSFYMRSIVSFPHWEY